jgi:hypothetical protein
VFDSQALDVAIGLVLLFFVLALASSSIVEALAGILNIRGKKLKNAINQLVTDPEKTLKVWETSVFGALQAGTRATATSRGKSKKTRTPAYVSARSFADATIEAISELKTGAKSAVALEQQLPAPLKTRLDAITNEVGSDLTAIKAGLEKWFDETMERAAGAFKRWSQITLVVVALLLTVSLNASTTRVAMTLWNQAAVRDSVVQAARNVSVDENAQQTSSDLKGVSDTVGSLKSLKLPVGWNDWDSQTGAAGTIAGWLITALLVMLGAPFWYGLLTRLVSLRSTGEKPSPAAQDPTSATKAVEAMSTRPSGAVPLERALAAVPPMSSATSSTPEAKDGVDDQEPGV